MKHIIALRRAVGLSVLAVAVAIAAASGLVLPGSYTYRAYADTSVIAAVDVANVQSFTPAVYTGMQGGATDGTYWYFVFLEQASDGTERTQLVKTEISSGLITGHAEFDSPETSLSNSLGHGSDMVYREDVDRLYVTAWTDPPHGDPASPNDTRVHVIDPSTLAIESTIEVMIEEFPNVGKQTSTAALCYDADGQRWLAGDGAYQYRWLDQNLQNPRGHLYAPSVGYGQGIECDSQYIYIPRYTPASESSSGLQEIALFVYDWDFNEIKVVDFEPGLGELENIYIDPVDHQIYAGFNKDGLPPRVARLDGLRYEVAYDSGEPGATGAMAATSAVTDITTTLRGNLFRRCDDGYGLTGWTALRDSDGYWYWAEDSGSATEWAPSKGSGWHKYVFQDQESVVNLAANGRVVMNGQWTQMPCATITSVTADGTGKVGSTLTAQTVVSPPGSHTYQYQWLRDGYPIAGATSSSIILEAADVDHAISVTVRALLSGHSPDEQTSPPVVVAKGDIVSSVALSPNPVVMYQVLTASHGPTTPESASVTHYAWYRDGIEFAQGAQSSTYTTKHTESVDDLNKTIRVEVTLKADGYNDLIVSDEVVVDPIPITCSVSISGTPAVGEELVSETSCEPPSGVTISRQWLKDGSVITGATGSKYTVTQSAACTAVTVVVSATGPVHQPWLGQATPVMVAGAACPSTAPPSAPPSSPAPSPDPTLSPSPDPTSSPGPSTEPPSSPGPSSPPPSSPPPSPSPSAPSPSAPTPSVAIDVVVSGLPETGGLLTRSATVVPASASCSTTWLSDGEDTGVRGGSYVVRASDATAGSAIVARVECARAGYLDSAAESAPVTAQEGTITIGAVSITGTPEVGQTLSRSVGPITPASATGSSAWLRDGVDTGVRGGTYVVKDADVGAQISVRVTATKAGYVTATRTSEAVLVVGAVVVSVSVSGDAVVGGTLVREASISPASASCSTAWESDGVATGVLGGAYVVKQSDAGHSIRARVTCTKTDYANGEAVSNEVAIPAAPPPSVAIDVVVSGLPETGGVLTRSATVVPASASCSTKWLSDGADTGVRGGSYVVRASDATAGSAIVARVECVRAGYLDSVGESAPVTAQEATIVVGEVSILGTPEVGQTLSRSVSSITPASAAGSSAWLRDGVDTGVRGGTYVVKDADVGAQISVRVTATKAGYVTATRTSEAVLAVGAVVVSVSISGDGAVGGTLVREASVSPASASCSTAWESGGVATGVLGRAYVVKQSDAGLSVRARVTCTKTGYADGEAVSNEVAIPAAPTPSVVIDVVVSGLPETGAVLTRSATVVPASASCSTKWLSDGADTGVRGGSYVVRASDATAGSVIVARVECVRAGYLDSAAESTPVTAREGVITIGAVSISGTPEVGQTLSRSVSSITPASATGSSAWLRDGVDTGVRGGTYVVKDADVGAQISVRVTATKAGYVTATRTSEAVLAVGTVVVSVSISGDGVVGGTLVREASVSPASASCSTTWESGGVATGVLGRAYVVKQSDGGLSIRARVTCTKTGYANGEAVSNEVAIPAAPPPSVAIDVVVSGLPETGGVLTRSATVVPANASCSTKWLSDGEDTGVRGGSYVVRASDATAGSQIVARVECVRAGYLDSAAESAPVTAQKATIIVGEVSILGTPQVGHTLSRSVSSITPASAAGSSVWLRDGVDTGVRGGTYVVKGADVGAQISVRVTATKAGYVSGTKTSDAVLVVGLFTSQVVPSRGIDATSLWEMITLTPRVRFLPPAE